MTWRQDHMIPEPYLVITGMTYLMPAWLAWKSGFYYSLASNVFLCATTMSFHWFRSQWLFELDVAAVLNYVAYCSLNAYYAGPSAMGVWVFSTSYGVYSYFVGQQLSILSWDPDWNTQMFFHGLIHLSSAYGAWYVLTKHNELLLAS